MTERANLPDRERAQPAVARAIAVIELGLEGFNSAKPRGKEMPRCVSCHHEGIGLSALAFVRQRGFAVDETLMQTEATATEEFLEWRRPTLVAAITGDKTAKAKADPFDDFAVGIGYLVGGVADLGRGRLSHAARIAIRALLLYQTDDGGWAITTARGPLQADDISLTARAARLLKMQIMVEEDVQCETALRRAREWLMAARPTTSVSRAHRLLGLRWSGANSNVLREATRALLADQRADGGWGEAEGGDAYSTGVALFALHQAGGVQPADPAFRSGVSYLLERQAEDGSWRVAKTARAYQKYFDGGFPYGEDQYISLPATAWAAMALAIAAEESR